MEVADFDSWWNTVIREKSLMLVQQYGGLAFDNNSSKEEVRQYYEETRDYAKRHYMEKHDVLAEQKLNRYKVAAAFMIAILKARPLKKADMKFYKSSPDKYIFNEMLALYTGVMIIRGYLLLDAEEPDPEWSPEELKERAFAAELFRKTLPLDIVQRQRWELELYYLRHESCYNLLALAHELEDFVTMAVLKEKLGMNRSETVTVVKKKKGRRKKN